jgi:ubiquinone/menaquinone biosynthesis C-methylase UbiE
MFMQDSTNKYVVDIEEAAETGRLMEQDRLFTQAMGGLFPELSEEDLSPLQTMLDVACGPGGWSLEVAFTHPDKGIIGIDINETMINYAFAQARVRHLENVTFEVCDVTRQFEASDGSFDLVNARLLFAFMDRGSWPRLLSECRRVLKPGGIIRLTEIEMAGSTNSLAQQTLLRYFNQALASQGRTFSTDGYSTGIAYMLARLLREAGFSEVRSRAFVIDASAGTEAHHSTCKDAEVGLALIKPFLLKTGVVQEEEYNRLYQQMLMDFMHSRYTAVTFGLTCWGRK